MGWFRIFLISGIKGMVNSGYFLSEGLKGWFRIFLITGIKGMVQDISYHRD